MTKSNVDISVLMSVYNEPREWLCRAIDSILNQTFSNFEFIIINDNPGSAINKPILDEYAEKDKRVKIIHNEVNIGLTRSLNVALRVATGEFVARMDADDISFPTRFEKQVSFLRAHTDYIACGSNAVLIDDKDNQKEIITRPESDDAIKSTIFFSNPLIHPTLFFRRKECAGLEYNTTYKYAQDYELISNLAVMGRLYNFQEPLLYYRNSPGQISTNKRAEQNRAAYQIRQHNIERYLSSTYGFQETFQLSPAYYRALMELFRANKQDRKNLSEVIYSIIYFSGVSKSQKLALIAKSQVIREWSLSKRARLLASCFANFPELQLS